jgi:uncharacterized membrane protein/mono/diheme cytochrome c family protein
MTVWLQWFGVFGRLHPLLVHAPIGFVLVLAVLELVAWARQEDLPRGVVSVVVVLAALSAVFAAASGLTLSREDGYATATVDAHRRLGVGVALASILLAIVRLRTSGVAAYRIVLAITLFLLLPAGHLGGRIAHGEGFLTEPLREPAKPKAEPAPSPAPAAAPASISYVRDIAPIFASRCSACHGGTKKKGGLSLKDAASIVAGGRNGPVILPAKPAESEMLRRLRLPTDDDDHMPPLEKPQPTADEIATIEKWVAAGAPLDSPGAPQWGAAELPPAGDARTGAESDSAPQELASPAAAGSGAPGAAGTALPGVAPADPAALEALASKLVHVEALAKDSNLLVVSFSAVAKDTGDAEAKALLEPILVQVADLTLARSRIGDETMKLAARMPNLSRLDVRETAVGDEGVAALKGHAQLAELVLARTKLSDASVESLLAMPALKKVFAWNAGIGAEALARLRQARTDLAVDAGADGDAHAIETEPDVVLKHATGSGGADGAQAPVNSVCPVSGKPVDRAYEVVFKGRIIGFCCPNCPKEFWADPSKFASKLP